MSDTSVDGYTETIGYNNMGRRTSFSAGSLYSFSLGYNSAGSVNSIVDSMGSWTYGYDPYFLGRLTSATCTANCPNGWGALSWTYDEYGNRWKQIVTSGQGPQPSYIFDTHNRILGSGVVYDNAGNMVQDGLGDTYTYDADSRMVGQQGFKYVVDALGNRVASTNISSGWETDYVYSGSTLVHRNDANANGWGFESGFGVYYGNNSSHFYRNYTDQVATERVQTQYSTSGSTVYETCENLAFGDAFPCQHPQGGYGGDVYWFAGLFTDPGANGNDNHAVAREYSGSQGRWESPDPAGMAAVDPPNPQTWNGYAYVMNNPLSFVDPTGLKTVCDDSGNCQTVVWGNGGDWWGGGSVGGPVGGGFVPPNSGGGGGGGDRGTSVSAATQPGQQPCVNPNLAQKAAIAALGAVAAWTGKTVGYGAGVSGGAGNWLGAAGGASQQLVVSPNGQAAFLTTVGSNIEPFSSTFVGPTFGVGALGGVQLTVSNATNPQQLRGGSLDTAGGYANGVGLTADVAISGNTYQSTLTLGFGGGAWGGAVIGQQTYVTSVCASGSG